jgi:hypothetical protein
MGTKVLMTVNERVMIHLLRYYRFADEFEVPFDLTQYGIAHFIGIQQKHVPRAMKKLMDEEMVEERVSHIIKSPRKQKVYFLTQEGFGFANNLKDRLMESVIRYQTEIEVYDEIPLSQAIERLGEGVTILDIILNLTEDNILDPETFEKMDPLTFQDFKEQKASMEASKEEVYKTALKRAWADKKITADEKAILDDLKSVLRISETEHKTLESEALRELELSDYLIIYETALKEALNDGIITDDEFSILENLRKKLRISEKTEKEMKEAIEKTLDGD